jgi:hypothetical protein
MDDSNAPEGIEELKAFIRSQKLKFELMKDKLELNPAIDDLLMSDDSKDIKAAEGNTTCDIDSIIAFLDDLGAIKADMKFEINPAQITNLRDSVHLHYKSKAVHKHTNCLLATFGAYIKFSLYLIAPNIPTKQHPKKGEIMNAMRIDVLQSLMDDCLLPAIKLIIPATQRTSFPELWIEVKDKARVPWIENKKTKQQQNREQHIDIAVAAKFVPAILAEFERNLKYHIKDGHPHLVQLEDYRFLISAKDHKDFIFEDNLGDLFDQCYEKVLIRLANDVHFLLALMQF